MLARLLSKAEVADDGCWLFTGTLVSGYGQLSTKKKRDYVHRLSWLEYKGEIPKGQYVLHKCDVRHCINPQHLFLGTYQDNSDDMIAKGRDRHQGELNRGELNGVHVLTEEEVLEIRRLGTRNYSAVYLADMFSVSRTTIRKVLSGETWRHLW